MGSDIWGNSDNRDIHGNAMDRNIHGNSPSDIHGNPWGGGSSAPSWSGSGSASSSGSGATASAGYPSQGSSSFGTWGGGGSAPREESSTVHVLAVIGILMIAASVVAWFLTPTVLGVEPTRFAITGLILFLIGTFPKVVGVLLLVGCAVGLYEAGSTPAGWSRAGIADEALAAGVVGMALGIGVLASAVTPIAAWNQKGRHRTLTALVVVPIGAIVLLAVVFAPGRRSPANPAVVPAVVTASSLNLRAGPAPRGVLLGTLMRGDTILITGEERNGWIPIVHARRRGYVSAKYLSRLATTPGPASPR
jgi:hypothetical protein